MELGAVATATPRSTNYTEATAAGFALIHGRPTRVDIDQVDTIETLINDRPATPCQCHEEECAIAHRCVRLANALRKRYELRYNSNLGRNGTTDVVGREQCAMVRFSGQGWGDIAQGSSVRWIWRGLHWRWKRRRDTFHSRSVKLRW